MTNKKWFLLLNNQVSGAFESNEIERVLSTSPTALIWGKGFNEWVQAAEWRQKMNQIISMPNETAEIMLYSYKIGDIESKPMQFQSLIESLRSEPRVSNAMIWSSQTKSWNPIYAHESVTDELGMSRRNHPRVPILGKYEGEGPNGPFSHMVVTISQGGLGLGDAFDFNLGDRLKGTLSSSNLYTTLTCFSEVVYVGADGYVGLRFVALPREAQSSIIEYVKKFGHLQQN